MAIEKFAVRLEGLPWKWIRADKLGLSPQRLKRFVAISKDAPDILALAIETREGYEFVNVDFYEMRLYPVQLRVPGYGQLELREVYVPLGFALDVEAWQTIFPGKLPEGEWVDFCDLARTVDEGGDADRYFTAHYVGPSWWVIPFPIDALAVLGSPPGVPLHRRTSKEVRGNEREIYTV